MSKAIDKAAGAEREVVSTDQNWGASKLADGKTGYGDYEGEWDVTAPATPEAQRWQGWGTALKPAHEPIVVARKPLVGTVAQTVSEFGTGALNIDGCRIGTDAGWSYPNGPGGSQPQHMQRGERHGLADVPMEAQAGRWPANCVLSHLPECGKRIEAVYDVAADAELVESISHLCAPGCPVAELDRQSGEKPASFRQARTGNDRSGWGLDDNGDPFGYGDTGGGSRFFKNVGWQAEEHEARFRYQAKASRAERNAGLEGFEGAITDDGRQIPISNPYLRGKTKRQNVHPTVKPVELMRWLCCLVTPPAGTVLDPFTGSGTTGIACVLEDFDFIGIEREAEYVEIAKARIGWWDTHKDRADEILALSARSERERQEHVEAGQIGLFEDAA